MSNLASKLWKKRQKIQFGSKKKLKEVITKYFDEHETYAKQSLNNYLGINRQNVYDWGKSNCKKQREYREIVLQAYEVIESILTHALQDPDNGKVIKGVSMCLINAFDWRSNPVDKDEVERVVVNITTTNEGDNKLD